MASQASPPAVSPQGRGPEGSKRRPAKSSITRVRTGCWTCRKRRKKCDERRPTCSNCQRTNVVCEGFPQQVFWETRSSARRAAHSSTASNTQGPSFHASPNAGTGSSDSSIDCAQWVDPVQPQVSPFYGQAITCLDDRLFEDDMTFGFDPFSGPRIDASTGMNQGTVSDNYQGISRDPVAAKEENSRDRATSHSTFHEAFIPIELPFLITGVDTAIHQRLFCHFTGVMSHVLTIFSGQANPFNQVVIPMALADQNVMNTLLCLAGSHLLKVQPTVLNAELAAERHRLHEDAKRIQALRVQDLRRSAAGSGSIYPSQYQENVLATSLLLCLFEICEGTGDGSWKGHLEIAREIVTASGLPSTNSPSSRTTDINPFLLEFFLYHDSLATVTNPSTAALKPQFRSLAELPDQDISMVGVQDGLIEFILQISALRAEADASKLRPDGNVICKAVQIWHELANWQPKSIITKERKLITEFYQWALFIWLYSIVYPDGKADTKVQSAVQKIAAGMDEIKSGDGGMACLLFPLFVVGSAAITVQDRDRISAQFRRLRAWSALGNIELTERVIRKMWDDHDEGLPGSWDWVKQLESHGMSLLVT